MKTGTRKLLSCAALAAGTMLTGSAVAHETEQTETARQADRATRDSARRAARAARSLLASVDDPAVLGAARCRIGNGKSALYTEGLYSCLTALAGGEYVIFVPRSEERP
jgi:hypothetical protein